jgi:hypothetical protein
LFKEAIRCSTKKGVTNGGTIIHLEAQIVDAKRLIEFVVEPTSKKKSDSKNGHIYCRIYSFTHDYCPASLRGEEKLERLFLIRVG